jgi:hypothetical protein
LGSNPSAKPMILNKNEILSLASQLPLNVRSSEPPAQSIPGDF